MYVVFESPLQMLGDCPSLYLREPECMEFLALVPTVWDETIVLDVKLAPGGGWAAIVTPQ